MSSSPGILPPLHALRAFEAVGRLGAVKDAALELFVTQSAISHQLRQLETTLGVKLFERRGRSLALTSAGREYFSAVVQALALIRDRTTSLINNRERDTVTVSTLPSFGINWLIPRLALFRTKRPGINVHLKYFIMGDAPPNDAADLRVRYGDGNWLGYECRKLLQTSLVVVCNPNYIKGEKPIQNAEDLRKFVLIHDENLNYWRTWFREMDVENEYLGAELIFQDQHMVISAALAGQGIALCRSALIAPDIAEGRLIKLFDHTIDEENSYYLCWRDDFPLSPAAKLFRDWLLESALFTFQADRQ
ncbi:LysR family transcriptional regulator [Caballeronia udeis]|uniref:LysR family transcriptional regulator n=1 Tax=Caballeronia udeis TaxID=1232866 RepID=A0A158GZ46_9BURK|nr:transcriptional regulator GcvA [Caballeronia udeis]SAL37395.1 LysR family transcriptional regulator [Caballeronia udeis]